MSENYILEHLELGNKQVQFKHLTYDVFNTLDSLFIVFVTDEITNDRYSLAYNVNLEEAGKAIAEHIDRETIKSMSIG